MRKTFTFFNKQPIEFKTSDPNFDTSIIKQVFSEIDYKTLSHAYNLHLNGDSEYLDILIKRIKDIALSHENYLDFVDFNLETLRKYPKMSKTESDVIFHYVRMLAFFLPDGKSFICFCDKLIKEHNTNLSYAYFTNDMQQIGKECFSESLTDKEFDLYGDRIEEMDELSSLSTPSHGGKREGAGRKEKPKTKQIRIDKRLAETFKEISDIYRELDEKQQALILKELITTKDHMHI